MAVGWASNSPGHRDLSGRPGGSVFALVVAGVILLGIGGGMVRRERRRSARGVALRSAPVLGCAEVAERTARGPLVCQLSGTAEAGPAGPLTAPLSGAPCVWYHVRVSARRRGRDGPSYDRRAHQETSTAPFRLRAGDTAVLVDPDGITADFVLPQRVNTGYPKTVERFEKSGGEPLLDLGEFAASAGGTDQVVGHLYEEWAIAPDVRVYVLGAAGAGPDGVTLGRPGSGPFLLSVSDPARQAQVACAGAGNRRAPAMAYAALGAAMLVAGVLLALL